jgi:hypothetical protein
LKDFVAALARTIKVKNKTKILTDQAYGNKSLKRMQIFQIIKEIKEGKTQLSRDIPTHQKNKHTEDIVAAAAVAIEENHRQIVLGLTLALRKIYGTLRRIMSKDIGLLKKSVLRVLKMLNESLKKDLVEKCNSFLRLIWFEGLGVLDRIVTMNE